MTTRAANALRGEASVLVRGERLILRPTFSALVAAEEELGPLFALVERAASGGLKLGELVALFWHCRFDWPQAVTREDLGEAVAAQGLAAATPALKLLLGQILSGRA
ncbi:GTA-gp10 family protein [Sphingobium sp. DEHP117]|uniref:GTA-gp10 family protein n=1 Tax=Sphingobium sp. DEHP117 TaxID=2993436 RepID=UPI0027D4EBFB|nr:GTA-gp10 family protein [Sphingobium sp. DEHP117]MDQ4420541.1 GTA-gp10 family protein [Sphingobium sp. DEHP117]